MFGDHKAFMEFILYIKIILKHELTPIESICELGNILEEVYSI